MQKVMRRVWTVDQMQTDQMQTQKQAPRGRMVGRMTTVQMRRPREMESRERQTQRAWMIARKKLDRRARRMSSVDQSPRILLQVQMVMQPQAQRAGQRPKRQSLRAWSLTRKRELKID
jgi:hypothetical protein